MQRGRAGSREIIARLYLFPKRSAKLLQASSPNHDSTSSGCICVNAAKSGNVAHGRRLRKVGQIELNGNNL